MPTSTWPASLWQRFMLQLDGEIPGYVRSPWFALNALVEVHGPLDLKVLDLAFGDLVRRHDVLRTRVEERGPEPVQVVEASLATSIEVLDGDPATEDLHWLYAPVPSEVLPPVRVRVIRRAPDVHLIGLHMHHLVTDPTTLWESMEQLAQLYSARLGGPRPAPPSAQYGEYAAVEARHVHETRHDNHDWWVGALGGLRLAGGDGGGAAGAGDTERSRPGSFVVERRTLLAAADLARIERWSRANRSTTFATLLAILAQRLGTLGETPSDLLFFTLFARRDRPAWQRMLGPCTVPAYVAVRRPPADLTPDFVTSVRDSLRGSQRHARLPLSAVESAVPHLFDRVGTGAGPEVPFVVYLPREWPPHLTFGPAAARVVQASGPRPCDHEPNLGIRLRKAEGGTLAARVSHQTGRWSREDVRTLLRALPDHARRLPGPV